VGRAAGVALLGRLARGHEVGVDVEHVHGPSASHVPRIGPQEVIQILQQWSCGMDDYGGASRPAARDKGWPDGGAVPGGRCGKLRP